MTETTACLRHAVATIAYRGGKVLRGAPETFANFECGSGARTPIQILAHVNDLLDWAEGLLRGEHVWRNSEPGPWDAEVARFHQGLQRFDDGLAASDQPFEALFQGPIADVLTHIGQIGMLRRLAGSPVKAENYFKARILAGYVGSAQCPPVVEFD